MTTNAYTFLPWPRAGISARITTDPGTAARASEFSEEDFPWRYSPAPSGPHCRRST